MQNSLYGIDYEEPIPIDDEDVVLENLPHLLSDEERTRVRQNILQPFLQSGLSDDDEGMIHCYTVIRSFVHAHSVM